MNTQVIPAKKWKQLKITKQILEVENTVTEMKNSLHGLIADW